MKTYLRCSIHVSTMEYPFKAPEYVQEAASELEAKCEQYKLKNSNCIYLIPVDTDEYKEVLQFAKEYKEFFHNNLFYQHDYTKKEMNEADYYLLKCLGTEVELIYEENEVYTHCCENSRFRKEQIGYYKMKKSSMKNKIIALSYDGRYIISKELKEAFEKAKLTNLKLLPVYDTKGNEIIAYQMEGIGQLPSLEKINNWVVYGECLNCNMKRFYGVHTINHPFYLPKEWEPNLNDLNVTSEVFSASYSRYYIISKKMFEILVSMGAKKLACEPITMLSIAQKMSI